MSLYQRLLVSMDKPHRNTISITKEVAKKIERDKELINHFISQKDVPAWFRGTSKIQNLAANMLFHSIRDDVEQQTSHRVRLCLVSIGIDPMIGDKDLRVLMRLSRGNDLAFLWFLLEMHYATPGEKYTLNEQLLMSVIAHLDMIATLRELDRIMPPAQLPKKEIGRQRGLKKQKLLKLKKTNTEKKSKGEQRLPYFESLVRPRPYGKPLMIPMPDFKVSLGTYEKYKNPSYVVPNESNRWYANHKFETPKRVVLAILNDEIQNIFQAHDDLDHTSKCETKMLCEHHKVIKQLEELRQHEVNVCARDRCLEYFDVTKKHKEASRKRVVGKLECDIAKYANRFRKLDNVTCTHRGVHVLAGSSDYDFIPLNSVDGHSCRQSCSSDGDILLVGEQKNQLSEPCCGGWMTVLNSKDRIEETREGGNCPRKADNFVRLNDKSAPKTTNRGDFLKPQTKQSKQPLELRGHGHNSMECQTDYDYGHSDKLTPSETYFAAPSEHCPYQFDYHKIFVCKENNSKASETKKFIGEALIDDVEVLKKFQNHKITMDEAVKQCADTIWTGQMEIGHTQNDSTANVEVHTNSTQPVLSFSQDYYDPDNKKLMSQMLKEGLTHLAKNRKFVLASMPEAHKLPVLLEWIKLRYGKVYSSTDRYNSFYVSEQIFKALEKLTEIVPAPHSKNIGKGIFVDYTCRDFMRKKGDEIRANYYKRLNADTLEQVRIFWFSMRPYLCSNGPPRNTYFAYMPSRVSDISRFRLWKSDDYRDLKFIRLRAAINQK